MKAWRQRKTPFTKFVVITMEPVKIPVFYYMVPCRLVDCLQASLLDSSSGYLHSVLSQKIGIFKTNHSYSWQQNEVTASCCGETAYCRGDWMDPTACLALAGNRKLCTAVENQTPDVQLVVGHYYWSTKIKYWP
jgi:hypothetical protein